MIRGKSHFIGATTLRRLAFLFGVVAICSGQTMSFSVYNGVSASSDGLYNAVTVQDNSSSSCSHSGYETTATIVSAQGRSSQSTSIGLTSNASLAIAAGDDGTYNSSGNGSYYCSCFRNTAGLVGDLDSMWVLFKPTTTISGIQEYINAAIQQGQSAITSCG